MDAIERMEQKDLKGAIPSFRSGDTVKVSVKVREGDKERIQIFQGVVLGIRGGGLRRTFTVRKIAEDGIGVERTFPINAPTIGKIEVVQRGKTRQAKLYYLRGRKGKAARIKVQEQGAATTDKG